MLAKPKLAVIMLSAAVVVYGFVGGMLEKVSAEEDDAYRHLAIFNEVLDKVKSDYVEEPDMAEAFQGALQGMMEALDPYSSFVPAATYATLQANRTETGSPGLIVSKRFGYLYVVAAIEGSPAERSGLRTGDLVESIDGTVTMRMSAWEAMARLQGPPGTAVKLRVVRARRTQPSEVVLTREMPGEHKVTSQIQESNIGVLRIPTFEAGVAEQVEARLRLLEASPISGLLIDLRRNAEGEIAEAVQAADFFLPRGVKVVSLRDRQGGETEYLSLKEPLGADLPVVVLIDGGTSGAAEIFAAALHDHKRGEVVGERSNGKGSLQEGFELADGARLFVSTTLFVRPNGKPLQGKTLRESGVTPDVRAPDQEFVTNFYFDNTSDDFDEDQVDSFYRDLDDAVEKEQFRKALERVKEKLEKKAA